MTSLPLNYSIELAKPSDVPDMIRVDRAAATLFEPTGLLSAEALDLHVPGEVFEQALLSQHVYLARDGGEQVAGFTLTSMRGKGLYLDQISVTPSHGQKGLGRALMLNVIEQAERRRCPHITLSTFRDLPWNGPFYASLDFKEIPRAKLAPFMLDIERAQKTVMDVSQRCFMLRKVRRSLFRRARTA